MVTVWRAVALLGQLRTRKSTCWSALTRRRRCRARWRSKRLGGGASPQAKGKIERRFGTFQKRIVTLLAYEKITDYPSAQELLARELARQNRTVCRTTGLSPDDACAKAQEQKRTVMRPCPDPGLLDLHLALHLGRRVNADHQVDFLGRSWPISATARHTVTIIHHPRSQFWVVSQPPKPPQNRWPDILGKFSL